MRVLELAAIPFSPGDFPNSGINPGLLHCRQILLPSESPGKAQMQGPTRNYSNSSLYLRIQFSIFVELFATLKNLFADIK